ncbi:MAG: signal peptidase II [Clostridiales bacterium]|nr:signal peptidase II [Clostridiales bacterium]
MNTKCKGSKSLACYGLMLIVAVAIDQLTKYLADFYLNGGADIVIIEGVFRLHYLENSSAAFGIDPITLLQEFFSFSYFEDNPNAFLLCRMAFFIVLTVIVLGVILYIFRKIPDSRRFLPINLAIVFFASGAVGNMIDRIWHRYVIDFFYFELIDFPVFNVADIYVTLSAISLVVLCLFHYNEADYELIFPEKGNKEPK